MDVECLVPPFREDEWAAVVLREPESRREGRGGEEERVVKPQALDRWPAALSGGEVGGGGGGSRLQ